MAALHGFRAVGRIARRAEPTVACAAVSPAEAAGALCAGLVAARTGEALPVWSVTVGGLMGWTCGLVASGDAECSLVPFARLDVSFRTLRASSVSTLRLLRLMGGCFLGEDT